MCLLNIRKKEQYAGRAGAEVGTGDEIRGEPETKYRYYRTHEAHNQVHTVMPDSHYVAQGPSN